MLSPILVSVVTIQLPKAEKTKPRRIKIQGSQGGSDTGGNGHDKLNNSGNDQTIDGQSQSADKERQGAKAQGANI